MHPIRDKTAIVGVGSSPQGKLPGSSALTLAVAAFKRALDDSGLRKEQIDAGEKRGKGLPGTGWRRNQRVPSGLDDRPGLGLHLGRDADGGLKPLSDEGVKAR